MSVKNINKEILVTNCLNGNIIARFPYDIMDNAETFKNLIATLTYNYIEFGLMIKVN